MTENLRAENERLTNLNKKLANQIVNMSDKLEQGRRELLATGWDECVGKINFISHGLAPKLIEDLKRDNPYRKPVIDLSGAIFCETGDDQ
ncbi:Mn-dependent DtxR family transcriptional regulator [Paenarthrobacter nicotinovorans]|uniref:Mn-dependent DtxR family transcriptional regulator n=1 Tax=Paenarthrobacter nicotinovorans TaxID=29320 RepID=A0ABT9TL07_PAENI|nr:hypothetical protein [Paenarthrobacter nicotinovorans]MDQ0102333.1 Mn-dependent DtxR family transcriptional regulator [Paenarthrobacter nicotinovorans]